ncbi:MAG: cytochrome c [Nannocystaceae bacterium]
MRWPTAASISCAGARRRLLACCLSLAACRPVATPPPPAVDPTLRHDLELSAVQAEYLQRLAAAADAHPDDAALHKASGLAHMRFALSGVLSLQARAERDLEIALRLEPGDRELARALGRFYNMRAVERDGSKATAQIEAYRAYLGDVEVARMSSEQFVAYAFSRLGQLLELRNRGRMLAAYGVVRQLEAELRARTEADPNDLELWAVAGNFAFFFAGNIPTGKRERVRAAIGYFTRLRERWNELRPGARDPEHCPNTYENFMFELAEGHLALGELEHARPIYRELAVPHEPVTRPKQQIAFVAAERLRNLERYAGKMELMPPWPSDVGNCVVCHAYTSEVPLTTLYTLAPLTLDDMGPATARKPVPTVDAVPDAVREVIARACGRCHAEGGIADPFARLQGDAALLLHSAAIGRRVAAGEMPPDQPLDPADAAVILGWLGRAPKNGVPSPSEGSP